MDSVTAQTLSSDRCRSLSWNQVAAAAKLRRLAALSLSNCTELPGVCLAELTPLARCGTAAAVNTHAHAQVTYHLPGQCSLHGRTSSRSKVLSQHQASHQACAHVPKTSCCFRTGA
jgi:hypothetical protein